MNKDLYGKIFPLPDSIVTYLQQCFDSANGDESIEGFKRNKELRDKREVSYQQLKRIKNWFDGFNGHETDKPFVLNGGHYVKDWVNNTLTSMRDDNQLGKEIKSVVLPNQFNQPHQKNNITNLNRPSKEHSNSTTLDRLSAEINENLQRINDLIKKII
jgi:hypothetical protein